MIADDIENRLSKVISRVFRIPKKKICPVISYQSIPEWDSMGHLNLVMAIEQEFNCKISQEDVIELDSVGKIIAYLKMGKGLKAAAVAPSEVKEKTIHRGLKDVYLDKTEISLIDGERSKLAYRGYDIDSLVQNATFEEVAYLLLFKDVPTEDQLDLFKEELKSYRQLPDSVEHTIKRLIKDGQDINAILRTGVSVLVASLRLPAKKMIMALVSKAPLILGYYLAVKNKRSFPVFSPNYTHAEFCLSLILGDLPSPDVVRIYEQNMIIQAEHGLNASALAARVSIGAGGGAAEAIVAAMSVFVGSLHGGALLGAMNMVEEIGTLKNVSAYIQKRIQLRKPIYGFGHRIYHTEDPRAKHLKKSAEYMSQKMNSYHSLNLLEAVKLEMREYEAHGMAINVDFYGCISYCLMGISKELLVPIFTINRIVGWGAHILEQKENNVLIRPRLFYDGPEIKPYVKGNRHVD